MFTPRHMRKRYASKGGTKDKEKQRAFKRAAGYSKMFIHQSCSALEKMGETYEAYKRAVGDGTKGLRRGK